MLSINNKQWRNWSGSFLNKPEKILYPRNENDIVKIIKHCNYTGKKMRIIGAGHSFTPLAVTNGILVSLQHLSGIEKIDYEKKRVTIWGGTTLTDLGKNLHKHGLTMENLGDINLQTIAGAVSTGTHGSGVDFGNLSTQITELTLITPQGDKLLISANENSHLFEAACLSLGLLGVITKVEIKVIKAHQLISISERSTMNQVFPKLTSLTKSNRHFEFFWFPHTETIQIKTLNPQQEGIQQKLKGPSKFNDFFMENGALGLVSEMSRIQPKLSKFASKMIARGVRTGKTVGQSYQMYATPRLVKFNEMEYSIPAEHMASALEDINDVIQKNNFNIHFPIECRYVKADNLWLSPSYKRDTAYIAVHMYKGMAFEHIFQAIEEVFKKYEGRPHWGKLHTLEKDDLQKVYSKFNHFLELRKQFDTKNILLNHYLENLF